MTWSSQIMRETSRSTPLSHMSKRVAPDLMLAGGAVVALSTLLFGNGFVGVEGGGSGPWLGQALASLLLLGSLVIGLTKQDRRAWRALALLWAVTGVSAAVEADSLATLPAWVPVAQAACLAAAAWSVARPGPRETVAAIATAGFMLILFGAVHLTERDAIEGLLPAWLPLPQLWPWLTGSFLIAAGLVALIRGRSGLVAAAALFASWIVLVHAERLIATPASGFEWGFAGMCLALSGALLLIGRFSGSAQD